MSPGTDRGSRNELDPALAGYCRRCSIGNRVFSAALTGPISSADVSPHGGLEPLVVFPNIGLVTDLGGPALGRARRPPAGQTEGRQLRNRAEL